MFLYSILTIDSPYINAGYFNVFLYVRKTIDEWVFGWRLCASWTQSSDHSLRFGRRCLLSVCCSLRDGAPRRALYGPWHIDEQLYRSELCSALGAHSLLNQWANQSMLAHTQPTAEPLSGPSSLTLTPAQVAGDTLIHLSQAQTDSSHHIPAISILSISPSLTRSVTQTHFLSSVSLSPFVSHTVSFSLYLCTHPFPCRCISLFPDPSLNPPPVLHASAEALSPASLFSPWVPPGLATGDGALVKLTHTSLPINICSQWGLKWLGTGAVLIRLPLLPPRAPAFDYKELLSSCTRMSENIFSIHNSHMEVESFDAAHLSDYYRKTSVSSRLRLQQSSRQWTLETADVRAKKTTS